MKYAYVPEMVCPQLIQFEMDGNIVKNISFVTMA